MKIMRVEVAGLYQYGDPVVVDLADAGPRVGVVGQNANGKSNWLWLVPFAFWGVTRGGSLGSAITVGKSTGTVQVDFTMGGDRWRVRRTLTRRKSKVNHSATLFQFADGEWVPRTAEGAAPQVNLEVTKLLGMTWQVAQATWFAGQKANTSFATQAPQERRDTLMAAFGLGRFKDMSDKAGVAAADTARALQARDVEVATLQGQLATVQGEEDAFRGQSDDAVAGRLATVQGQVSDADEVLRAVSGGVDVAGVLVAAEAEVARFDAAGESVRAAWARGLAAAERLVAAAKVACDTADTGLRQAETAQWKVGDQEDAAAAALAAVDAAQAVYDGLRGDHERVVSAAAAAAAAREAHQVALAGLRKSLTGLDASVQAGHGDGRCVVCRNPLTVDQVTRIRASYDADIAGKESEIAECGRVIERATQEQASLKERGTSARAVLDAARDQAHRASTVVETTRVLVARIPELEAERDAARERVAAAEAEVSQCGPEPMPDVARRAELVAAVEQAKAAVAAAGDRRGAEAHLTELRSMERELVGVLHARQARTERVKELTRAIQAGKAAAAPLRDQMRREQILKEAFSFRPGSIPWMMMASIVDEISEVSNDILARFGGSMPVRVRLSMTAETSTGPGADRIMVYVAKDATGEIDFNALGGSEQDRVAIALRAALLRCIARRHPVGAMVETLFIDEEGWNSFDSDITAAAMAVYEWLSAEMGIGIWTISHNVQVVDWLTTQVQVDAESGFGSAQLSTAA